MNENTNNEKNLPKVIASGYLEQFNNIPCYNLDNGQRVFRLTDMTIALRGKAHGKFANYLAAADIRKYIPQRLQPSIEKKEDRMPRGVTYAEINDQMIKTYDAEDFIDICMAFIEAADNNEGLSEAQQEIVKRAKAFIKATAKIGITGLIDEATGYQYLRPENELALKLNFFLADELRDWNKTFPDELWIQFGRLTNWKGNLHQRPKYWASLVREFIYDYLDQDVANWLYQNRPPKITGKKYHQWLNEERGVRKLLEHIHQVIGITKTCDTIDELRYQLAKNFSKDIFQPMLFEEKKIIPKLFYGNKKSLDKMIKLASRPSQELLKK